MILGPCDGRDGESLEGALRVGGGCGKYYTKHYTLRESLFKGINEEIPSLVF